MARAACTGAASLGHRLSKNKALWSPDARDHDLDERADEATAEEPTPSTSFRGPSARVETELRKWATLWRAEKKPAQMPEVPNVDCQLRQLTAQDLRLVAKSFKKKTGLGTDAFHPRWLLLLSDQVVQELADILMDIEEAGRWPDRAAEVLAVFIPKADGGLRPILLYTTVYRIWAKARLDYVRRWEATHPYPFFWGGRGRAVERCA